MDERKRLASDIALWLDDVPASGAANGAAVDVLVASDCSDVGALTHTVQALGHRLVGRASVRQADSLASVDAVLLDLRCEDVWDQIENAVDDCPHAPVLVVAPDDVETTELMRAMRLGATGYLLEPIEPVTLDAWLRWAARRAQRQRVLTGAGAANGERLAARTREPLVIDVTKRKVWVHGHELQLAPREFELLTLLERYRDRVVRREWLLRSLWQVADPTNTRALDVRISGVRKAIAPYESGGVPRIETVRGSGYRLVLT